jgi:predicted nucleotidyltransferase
MSATAVSSDILDEIVHRITTAVHPRRVILFGSRARGQARATSDLDLLVIADSEEPRHLRSAPLYGLLSDILVPMDIVVYTPREVEEWSAVRQAFVTTAVREGKVLYEEHG